MHFKYNEYFTNNKNKEPQIYLGFENCPTTEFNFISFLDRLSNNGLNELNNIFNYSNRQYINEEIWLKYEISHSIFIQPISSRYTKMIDNHNEDGNGIKVNYFKNKKLKTLSFNNEDFLKTKPLNLFESMAKNGSSSFRLTIHKEATYNNERELLYIFLECLFNSRTTYYIMKCKYCEKYYIVNKPNIKYCKRTYLIQKKPIRCGKIRSEIKKTNDYQNFIINDKNLKILIQDKINFDKYIEYLNKRDEMIEECIKKRDLSILNDFIITIKSKYHFN